MRTTLNLFYLFGLLVSLVFAVPTTSHLVQKGSFKVERVRNPHYVEHQYRNLTHELYEAYIKYGLRQANGLLDSIDLNTRGVEAEPHDATSGAEQESKVTASVKNYPANGKNMYLSPITIGGQRFYMDFDTGSAVLWVRNTYLADGSSLPQSADIFDPSKSSTFKWMKNKRFDINYIGDHGVSGLVGNDTVNIGGATVTQQAIGLPTKISDAILKTRPRSSGVVGLNFSPSNSEPIDKTFFDNIAPHLKEQVFTADLRDNEPGSFEFGFINKTKFAGELQYADVGSKNHWLFSSPKVVIQGKSYISDSPNAVADTGATIMFLASNIVNAYYKEVRHATNYKNTGYKAFPCGSKLPDIKLSVGDYLATVSGEALSLGKASRDSEQCIGAIQAHNWKEQSSNELMIFGGPFFKSNFVVFDYGKKRVGFAPHAS